MRIIRLAAAVAIAITVSLGTAGQASATCPNETTKFPQDAPPPPEQLEMFKQAVFCLENEQRRVYGLPAYTQDPRLSAAAQARADDMVANHYFAHVSPIGRKAADELRDAGYPAAYAGENIVSGFSDARDITLSWMVDFSHCRGVLDATSPELGVGMAFGAPISSQDPRAVYDFTAHIAARQLGQRASGGSIKPGLGCPYLKARPTSSGLVFTKLTKAESLKIRCKELAGVNYPPAKKGCKKKKKR